MSHSACVEGALNQVHAFIRGGPNLITLFFFFFFFLLMSGGRIKIPLLAGHYRLASETPLKWRFLWRADDGPTLNAGLVAL